MVRVRAQSRKKQGFHFLVAQLTVLSVFDKMELSNKSLFGPGASGFFAKRPVAQRLPAVFTADHTDAMGEVDFQLLIPATDLLFAVILEVRPMQLLSYYTARS